MKRLLHIADMHFGREHTPLVDAFSAYCREDPPDIVIATGDFTQGARRREFALVRKFVDTLSAPVVGAPGNHDVPSWALDHRFFSPWRRFESTLDGKVEPRFRSGEMIVETLHTARRAQWGLDWSLGRVSKGAAALLARKLDTVEGGMRVVACHHPLLAPGGSDGRAKTKRGEAAAEALAPSADLVLTGHLHQTFALPVPSASHVCWFVGASTTFSERTRDEPAGFNEIVIDDDHLTLTHYESHDAESFVAGRSFRLPRRPDAAGVRPITVDPV